MNPLRLEDVADCIEWMINRPTHVNFQELVVSPKDQGGVGHVYRHPKN